MSKIHVIETAVPPHAYHQEYAAGCMKRWVKDRTMQRMVHHVYKNSGIERRFSVLPDFQPEAVPTIFREQEDGTLTEPTTGQRNKLFEQSFPSLAREAVQKAFHAAPWIAPSSITHVITVSCTGFCNPGPDLYLAHTFNLSPSIERYHLGFMGCYAAFPALRMADQFCKANPEANVLVLCLELCTLHLQVKPTPDSLLANALFADGAAAVLISNKPLPEGHRGLSLESFATRVIPGSESDMAWTIGDRGFDMILSSYVPKILGLHARELIRDVLQSSPVALDEIADWAVHPGGKAILSALEQQMGWMPDRGALALAHRVLRDYGNMSSATILFVLAALMKECPVPSGSFIGALAFGPGLTVEFGLLSMIGDLVPSAAEPASTNATIP